MQVFIDYMVSHSEFLQGLPQMVVSLAFQVVFCLVVFLGFVMPFAALAVFFERRIAGRIQSRVGPNLVGPQGILQSIADGVKLLLKEDIIPSAADELLFRLAPYLVLLGMLLAFVAIPFSSSWIIADLQMGVFYLLAVESLVVVGIVMSGWASNNKWSLLGGMRSAAQIISYEVPVSLSILLIVLIAGDMSVQGIISKQGFWPWQWHLFQTPFTFIAFFVFFTGALAEGNRTPFDIPEAESELVSGYNTEYSGFRFSLFFLAEYANIYLMSAVANILFLGGWKAEPVLNLFGLGGVTLAVHGFWSVFAANIIEMLVFQLKSFALVFFVIQLRWTVPRVRVDQLMSICWKYLVPVAFLNLILTSIWMVLSPQWGMAPQIVSYIMTGLGFFLVFKFMSKVFGHVVAAKKSGMEITFNPLS